MKHGEQKEETSKMTKRWFKDADGRVRYHAVPESVKKQKRVEFKRLSSLRWRLTLFVFSMLILSGMLTFLFACIAILLFKGNPVLIALILNPLSLCLILLCTCAIFGTILSAVFGRYYLRPLKQLISATREVRNGNYKIQVKREGEIHTEMGVLVQNFNEMVRELDGVELFRNDFINNFSHEFKTPIVSIRGFAKELQLGNLTEEQRKEYIKIILEESDRLSQLSTGVLELSKLENQQIVSEKQELDLAEQIRQCILLQEPSWGAKEIEIIPELDDVKVFSNAEMLERVWSNLISNAIKFTPEKGCIYVTLKASEKEVSVQVRDTGVGMSEEVQAHIFEKFYQGDPAHNAKGYGIGLALVKRVVMLLRGQITVESDLGKGSAFTVVLPIE